MHGVCSRGERLARLSSVRSRTGLLSVDHIAGDGQHRKGGNALSIGGMFLHFLHERLHQLPGDGIDALIVVAIGGIASFNLKIDCKAALVPDRLDLGILDGRQAVCNNAQAGDSACHGPDYLLVVQSHFQSFIAVFIVHVMNDVQRIDIQLGKPAAHRFKAIGHGSIVQVFIGDGSQLGTDLLPALLIAAAVDCIEQGLGQIDACAEELHLLADPHRRDTAGNTVIVTVVDSHQIVVLILNRGGFDRELCTVVLEGLGKILAPQYRKIRLGRRSEIGQAVKEPVAHFGDHVPPIEAHASD
ncbi:hypothetical protein DSECCO2_389240 [anaerobic digester metagenome]